MIEREPAGGVTSRFFYWWADHPAAQALLLIVVTAAALVGYLRPEWARSWLRADPVSEAHAAAEKTPLARADGSHSHRHAEIKHGPARGITVRRVASRDRDAGGERREGHRETEPFQVAGGDCVLVVQSENFFSQSGLRAMRRVADELEAMPQVRSVLWLDNVPSFNLFGLSGTLLPSSNASPRQMQTARERVLDNPLAVGQLISADAKTMLMHIRLDWFFVTNDTAATDEIRRRAEQAAAEVAGSDLTFQLTGTVPLHLMMLESHVNNSMRYQLIGYSIMVLSALVLFRGLAAVLIVAIAPATGVFWTMGMLHFFDLQDNPFNDIIVPVLISLVGLTDAVHLMVEIRHQRAAGFTVRDATRRGLARVGLACLLTSLTTAIGFISLSTAHHEIVREFGWCCVLGVTMTLLSVLTVVPLGCRSPLGRRLHVGLGKSLVDRQLKRIGPLVDGVLRHARAVSVLAIVSTALLVLVCLRLQPDEKRYSGLSESGEAAQALRHLDRALGGLEFGFVSVQWIEAADPGEVLNVLQQVERQLDAEPLIGHPLGLHDLIAALPGEGSPEERMTLLELLPTSLKRAFYDPESRRATVQFRIQDLGIAAYGDTFTRIEAGLRSINARHPRFALELDGDAPWRWRNIYRIVTDLATSLGTASLVILLVLTIVYRSIRIGLISVVPNLFPLAATGALLVVTGQHLEMVTVCVFTICVGIAVDDTIHFLTRYQEEMRAGGDHQAVIRRAFTGVGAALMMTTIVLVAGMMSAVVGDARDARLFGMMGALTLATALFADVVFLPALLSQFGKAKTARGAGRVSAEAAVGGGG